MISPRVPRERIEGGARICGHCNQVLTFNMMRDTNVGPCSCRGARAELEAHKLKVRLEAMERQPGNARYLELMTRALRVAQRARIADATGNHGHHLTTALVRQAYPEEPPESWYLLGVMLPAIDEWAWET